MEPTAKALGRSTPLPGYSPDPHVLGRNLRGVGGTDQQEPHDASALGRLAQEDDPAASPDYQASLTRLQDLATTYGVGAGELEDMKNAAPDLTEAEGAQYLSDKASSRQPPTWEDWLAERTAAQQNARDFTVKGPPDFPPPH